MKQADSARNAGAHVVFAGYDELMPASIRQSGHDTVTVPRADAPGSRSSIRALRVLYNRSIRLVLVGLSRPRAERRLIDAVIGTGADIVQSVDLPALGCASRASSELGSALVFDSHEMWFGFLKNPELRVPWLRRLQMLRMERRHAPRADLVLVVSDEMGRRMSERYNLREVMTVFNSPPGYATAASPTQRPVRLVFHGSLAATKNVEDLILAMVQLKGRATLDIHGAALTLTEDHLRRLVREHELDGVVTIHGGFRYQDVLSMLKDYDVDVYCARMIEDNFAISLPNKLFDAICAGLAVAASDFPAIRELLQSCGCGVCLDPASPETVAQGLDMLIGDTDAIDRMKAASLRVAPDYCWEAQGRKVVERLAGFAGEHAPS
jgi:glycosyltransferase involved in cell wall biosynthesis